MGLPPCRGGDLNADYENVFTIFPRLKERARQPVAPFRRRAADARHRTRLMARPACSCWTSRRWAFAHPHGHHLETIRTSISA
jgi:hypothetical protein